MNPLLPIEALVLLFALLAAWGGWSAWRSARRCGGAVRFGFPVLRVAAIVALAVVAANPGRWRAQRDDRSREWAVLLDASSSMNTREGAGDSRWTRAVRLAAEAARVAKDVDVKLFRFDSDLHPVASAQALAPDGAQGKSTDLLGAGQRLLDRYQASGKPPAGIILLTDGRQVPARSPDDFALRARTLDCPVYPLVLGETVATRDLALTTRRRQFIAFAGQPLTITARLTARNLGQVRPEVELLNAAGKVLATKAVAVSDDAPVDVRFELKPAHTGHALYRVRVPAQPGETRLANNEAEFGVVVVQEKIRVLLVEGTPYWDSKFMAQLFQQQANVNLTLLYRLTQDRYFSLDTAGALAAGNMLQSFPDRAAAIGRYDLIVVGKGFEYFLSPERLGALNHFVREHGGGLVFARGKPYSGRVPDLEPLEPLAWDREWTGDFLWQPTRAGAEAGLFGDRLPAMDDPVWTRLPPLNRAWQGERRQAFAQVLAEGVSRVGGSERRLPVVVSQQLGKGRVVVVNSDDLWQWDFFPKFAGASQLYQDFWLSLIHWTVVHADFLPGHDWSLGLSDQLVESGQPVRARVLTRATRTSAAPLLRVARGDAVVQELSPAAVPGRTNAWEGIFSVSQPGTYRVELLERGAAGTGTDASAGAGASTNVGVAKVFETLTVKPPAAEDDDLSPDREAMEKLAKDTGGRIIAEQELAALLQPHTPDETPLSRDNAEWASTWDRGPWLAGILALLGGEWFLRRRNGLT